MKTITSLALAFISILSFSSFAQNATVKATRIDISDNLDLRAVASIFGDSKNIEDFERRLNDTSLQISNLDLNNDNKVDYLRVVESVENNVNLIVVQAVLGREMFQDVATVELERNDRNNMVVQIVGNPYFYGNNYIYEPVFVSRPVIYDYFWANNYTPYYSPWNWGYLPRYYVAWSPFPIFRYRTHINGFVGYNNVCNYSNVRRYERAVRMYEGRRNYYYESTNPNKSFSHRNANISNRYELTQIRDTRTNTRTLAVENTRNNTIGNTENTRNNSIKSLEPTRNETNTRGNNTTIVNTANTRNNSVRNVEPTRNTSVRSFETNPSKVENSTKNSSISQPRATRVENFSSRNNSATSRNFSTERNAGNRRS